MRRNPVDNAMRRSPAGGQVTLRLAADAIGVIDQSPGVPAEDLDRQGDRFFRLRGAG